VSDSRNTDRGQHIPDAASPKRSLGESFYLGLLVVLSFAGAVAFLLMAAYARFVPATGIAFCFAIAIATLAYAFLGSKGSDQLNWRGLQLGGATAVVLAIIYFTSAPLERQMRVLERLEELSREAEAATERARLAEEKARQELIVEGGASAEITGGGHVRLEDINTLNGWREGPHAVNQNRPDRAFIFERIVARLDLPRQPADLIAMSETQWKAFVESLPTVKRMQVGGIPFARLSVQASDGRVQQRTVFKRDVIPVLNRQNVTEAYLCVRRVLDVRERRSDEAEVIVLTHSRTRCQ
jgi:hypothetical protein